MGFSTVTGGRYVLAGRRLEKKRAAAHTHSTQNTLPREDWDDEDQLENVAGGHRDRDGTPSVDRVADDRAGHAVAAAAPAPSSAPMMVMTSMPSLRSSVLV